MQEANNPMLTVLTDRDQIEAAAEQLRQQLQAKATMRDRVVLGFQGGSLAADGAWFKALDFWYAYEPLDEGERYWNAFGYGNPFEQKNVPITVEVNPPFSGLHRRIAGAFAQDEDGTIYLIHRGNVGGGRRGIGKNAFLAAYPEPLEVVSDGDHKTKAIAVGVVGSDSLIEQIEHFANIVRKFKDETVGKGSLVTSSSKVPTYTDEFAGTKIYDTKSRIVANVIHGIVVRHLKAEVERLGHKATRDQARDLYVPGPKAKVRALFEVKTDLATSSIYTAIGQLLFHGGGVAERLIAVLPAGGGTRVDRLTTLGIRIVTYSWSSGRPRFTGLKAALA